MFTQVDMNREQIIKYAKIGLAIGGAFLLFRFVRRQIKLAKLKGKFGDFQTITDNTKGNVGGVSLPQDDNVEWSPRPSAEALRDAMKGLGTDEDKIFNTLDTLNKDQLQKMRVYFTTYFGEGDTLFDWFDDDLSGSDLAKAKAYFN